MCQNIELLLKSSCFLFNKILSYSYLSVLFENHDVIIKINLISCTFIHVDNLDQEKDGLCNSKTMIIMKYTKRTYRIGGQETFH